jgi:cytochrome c-type biogenesis protein CcmE
MKRRHKRIGFIIAGLAGVGIAAAFVLSAFQSNLVFFYSPSQVAAKEVRVDRPFRVGGLVESGSLKRENDGLTVRFTVTDTAKTVPVVYKGILPDLFKEGKGCVAQGRLGSDGVFYADQVLAKHDENYMPPEAGQAVDAAKHEREAAKTIVGK